MSEVLLETVPWLLVGLLAVGALVVLRTPIKYLGKLILRTGCSLAALYLLSPLGAMAGITLGVNLVNALVMGLLGAPGLGLLLMLNWTLGV